MILSILPLRVNRSAVAENRNSDSTFREIHLIAKVFHPIRTHQGFWFLSIHSCAFCTAKRSASFLVGNA